MTKQTETLEAVEARLAERLRQGCPLKKKPKVEKPLPSAQVFSLNPWKRIGRKWLAYPVATTSALPYEPTWLERLNNLRSANADEARRARADADRHRLSLYGETQTIDELVRRQDEDWSA
jgi:hypothetical protein